MSQLSLLLKFWDKFLILRQLHNKMFRRISKMNHAQHQSRTPPTSPCENFLCGLKKVFFFFSPFNSPSHLLPRIKQLVKKSLSRTENVARRHTQSWFLFSSDASSCSRSISTIRFVLGFILFFYFCLSFIFSGRFSSLFNFVFQIFLWHLLKPNFFDHCR